MSAELQTTCTGPALVFLCYVRMSLLVSVPAKYMSSLPSSLWQLDMDFGCFKQLLKTFCLPETAAHLWLFVFDVLYINSFTYLRIIS